MPDPTDVSSASPRAFVSAAEAWCAHRRGECDLSRFGSREHPALRGEPFVAAKVVTELAHRYQEELLLWDRWGPMDPHRFDGPIADLALVDEVAARLVSADGDDTADGALRAMYRNDDGLHPGPSIHSISPTGAHHVVDLTTRQTRETREALEGRESHCT